MLTELSIRNFAIIDDLSITFSDGLSILSGETGAGKSIIINAVNLLLGGRANSEMIRSGAETAELEAMFDIGPEGSVAQLMRAQGIDPAEGLLVRRVISRNDRHRAYVNGKLSTMSLLSNLTENLASISGQHASQLLLQENQHLFLLDQFGGLLPDREAMRSCYHKILPQIQALTDLENQKNRRSEQMELYLFQTKEIREADLKPGEDEDLELEIGRLKNAGRLHDTVEAGIEALYSSQGAVVERLVEIKKNLEKAAAVDPELCPTVESINDTALQIEDLAAGLRIYLASLDTDGSRLELLEERLFYIRKIVRKYGKSIDHTINHLHDIEKKITAMEDLSESIRLAEESLKKAHRELVSKSADLSQKRRKAAVRMSRMVEEELASLKMPGTRFELSFSSSRATGATPVYLSDESMVISETGSDQVAFMIAPNVGEDIKPLSRIASGGELSRVVLAIKAILAADAFLETIVFDEVDAGIGGGAAEKIGQKLAQLARHHQVVCITHLPQIARFGQQHYRIYKKVHNNRTSTVIKKLDADERVREMARMLGGEAITDTTIEHAREMLDTVSRSK